MLYFSSYRGMVGPARNEATHLCRDYAGEVVVVDKQVDERAPKRGGAIPVGKHREVCRGDTTVSWSAQTDAGRGC